MKQNGLKLFVLVVEGNDIDTEVRLFGNWNSVVKCVAEKSGADDKSAIRESLNEVGYWVDEVTGVSYSVSIKQVED